MKGNGRLQQQLTDLPLISSVCRIDVVCRTHVFWNDVVNMIRNADLTCKYTLSEYSMLLVHFPCLIYIPGVGIYF